MKRKYYIRGIGVGVLITVIILSASYNNRMSDKIVMERAKELGMAFVTESPEPEPTEEPIVEETKEPEPEQPGEAEEGNMATPPAGESIHIQEAVPRVTPQGSEEDESNLKDNTKTSKVSITITRGMLSNHVAGLLEKKGLIGNAEKFNEFLEDNGYSKRIRIGNFQIPYGASFEEIAGIIATSGN